MGGRDPVHTKPRVLRLWPKIQSKTKDLTRRLPELCLSSSFLTYWLVPTYWDVSTLTTVSFWGLLISTIPRVYEMTSCSRGPSSFLQCHTRLMERVTETWDPLFIFPSRVETINSRPSLCYSRDKKIVRGLWRVTFGVRRDLGERSTPLWPVLRKTGGKSTQSKPKGEHILFHLGCEKN